MRLRVIMMVPLRLLASAFGERLESASRELVRRDRQLADAPAGGVDDRGAADARHGERAAMHGKDLI
jgi:hypothetical protein